MGRAESGPSNNPIKGFEYWDSCPQFPFEDWKYEVVNGSTRKGYWVWVKEQMSPEGRGGSRRKKN